MSAFDLKPHCEQHNGEWHHGSDFRRCQAGDRLSGCLCEFRIELSFTLVRRALLTAAGLMTPGHGVDPSILPKRRHRRVEAIIPQAARECSRCLMITYCIKN